jgi:hypothetical protein
LDLVEQFHRFARPYCPVPEKPAGETERNATQAKARQQIGNDIIVISRKKGDLAAAAAIGDRRTASKVYIDRTVPF